MCLMCEHYVDWCEEPECYEVADPYDRFEQRNGKRMTLWRGYGEPCEHIKAADPDWRESMEEL